MKSDTNLCIFHRFERVSFGMKCVSAREFGLFEIRLCVCVICYVIIQKHFLRNPMNSNYLTIDVENRNGMALLLFIGISSALKISFCYFQHKIYWPQMKWNDFPLNTFIGRLPKNVFFLHHLTSFCYYILFCLNSESVQLDLLGFLMVSLINRW